MSVSQLAPDIFQVQLPLPFALRSVNAYLLRGPAGWTVLDAGLHTAEGEAAWLDAFAQLAIGPRAVAQIVLTHFHPDHFGMAGWLQGLSGAPVFISPREAAQVAEVWALPADALEPTIEQLRCHGVPAELAASIADAVGHLRAATLPHPSLSPIAPGASIAMGGRQFQAIHAPGHSDGQLIFFAEDDGLMLCGDHVLMRITPHIGCWPNSEPDPLGRYMASLDALAALPVRLALSGHGRPIEDWAGRLGELRRHHAGRLDAMAAAIDGSASAYEVASRVFDFARYSPHEIRFAIAETLAHLELLAHSGLLRRGPGPLVRYLRAG